MLTAGLRTGRPDTIDHICQTCVILFRFMFRPPVHHIFSLLLEVSDLAPDIRLYFLTRLLRRCLHIVTRH